MRCFCHNLRCRSRSACWKAQLKVQLFQHAQRRVVLTPAGWEFYPKRQSRLLELYDDAVNCAQAAERNANPPKRHLLIGHQNDAAADAGI